jgi:hypothetical protein
MFSMHEPLLLTLGRAWDNSSHEPSAVRMNTQRLSVLALAQISSRCKKHHNTLRMAREHQAELRLALSSTSLSALQRLLGTSRSTTIQICLLARLS